MIPVRKLRQFSGQLDAMMAEFDRHYPQAIRADHLDSGPAIETIRNVATAQAEIEGWITARVQGRKRDPFKGPRP